MQTEKEDLFASFMEMTKNLDDVQTVLFETAYGYHAKADLYEGFYFQYPHLSGTLYLWDEELQLFEEEKTMNHLAYPMRRYKHSKVFCIETAEEDPLLIKMVQIDVQLKND